MRVAPEGWPFIILAWAIVAVLLWFGLWPVALDGTRCGVARRVLPRPGARRGRGDDVVIAPADGVGVSVIPIDEPKVIGGPAIRRVDLHERVFRSTSIDAR